MSIRGIWSDEANIEADRIMRSKMSGLNITGKNSKGVAKEVFNSMYELTKLMPGKPTKTVSTEDQSRLISMQVSDITRDFLVEMLADTVDCSRGNAVKRRPAKYNTWDRMTVPAAYFYSGQQEIDTTIGRFLFNRFVLEGSGTIQVTKYLNELMNKGGLEILDTKIGQYYMEDKTDRSKYNAYIDRRDTLGYWLNGMLAHTISPRMAKPLPEIEKLKEQLIKDHAEELAAGNIDVMTDIQNQLLAYAKEVLKDDPGMDLYLSGDLDFSNNYKNNSIVKGAVKNELTGEFDFISSSFMDGIKVEDLPAHANSILASQYPASIATSDSGYVGKKLIALLQMMEVDEPGSDCGRKRLIPTMITKHNSKDMVYSYIRVGSQDVLLTPENVGSYVGQRVLLYSPMSCLNQKICSKCAGQLFYMLEAKQAGLFSVQISHAALNLGLKAKHNSQVELYTLDPATLIQEL